MSLKANTGTERCYPYDYLYAVEENMHCHHVLFKSDPALVCFFLGEFLHRSIMTTRHRLSRYVRIQADGVGNSGLSPWPLYNGIRLSRTRSD